MTSATAPDQRFWNRIAAKYAARPVANPDAFDRKIAITRGLMHDSATVLDIGCGTGSLALRLASAGAAVHGLDFSEEMIRIARDKARTAGVENVFFHCAPFDSRWTELGAESLDGICAYSLLHLVEDPAATLAHIHHLLRPGGFFVSSTTCLAESWVPYGALIALMRVFGKAPQSVSSFTKRTLTAEIANAGFERIEQPNVGADKTLAFVVAWKPG
jgi:2-polyprenyl-3-methyl-5-hydroxy-6-metoxy-1,4-benzoquinol methylase